MIAAKGVGSGGVGDRDTRFPEAVRWVLERGVPLYVLFGDDDFRATSRRFWSGDYRPVFDAAGPGTGVKLSRSTSTASSTIEHQELLIRLTSSPGSKIYHRRGRR